MTGGTRDTKGTEEDKDWREWRKMRKWEKDKHKDWKCGGGEGQIG